MADLIKHRNYTVKRRIVSEYFDNVSMIHPLKQKQVFQLIDHLKTNNNVNKIIIFGSSVTNKCHTGSDLDFYIDLNKDTKLDELFSRFLDNYDYWNNFTVDERLLNEIKKKGVTVYERENIA